MEDTKNDRDNDQSLMKYSTDVLLLPIRIATSPILLRTYLRTILLFLTSTIFFGFAVIAYSSFYYSYIPIRGISVPVYLQYDHGTSSPLSPCVTASKTSMQLCGRPGKWPYGIANVPGLVDRQKYDVAVEMDVPRSDTNLRVGNWMIGLELRGPKDSGASAMSLLGWEEEWDEWDGAEADRSGEPPRRAPTDSTPLPTPTEQSAILARSRRPAILTYRSHLIEMAHRFSRLPFYLLGWHTESEHVQVSMMESVMFEQGFRNVPTSARVELRSRQPLEVYSVKVRISARLEGLRWLMYKYWLTSAIVGIGLFWGVEMGVLLFTWGLFTLVFGGSRPAPKANDNPQTSRRTTEPNNTAPQPKTEPAEDDAGTSFSDTSRIFPTLPSQPPLSYHSLKQEQESLTMADLPTREDAEADDEDDDFVLEDALPPIKKESLFEDSGLGTSMESSGVEKDGGGVARRRSGKRWGGDGG